MTSALQTDVLIRAWEPHLDAEGARFKAVTTRQGITVQVATGDPMFPTVETRTLPGLVVIAPSAGPGGQNAVDVVIRAIPDRIKFTILSTPELLWLPINAHRDPLMSWRIDCIPYVDWLRLRLGDTDPEITRSDDGR